jgi:hypothetical protein
LADAAPAWTPYRYGYDNPILFIDPFGLLENDPWYKNDRTGGFQFFEEDKEGIEVGGDSWTNYGDEFSIVSESGLQTNYHQDGTFDHYSTSDHFFSEATVLTDRYIFSKGESPFELVETTWVGAGEFITGSYGSLQISTSLEGPKYPPGRLTSGSSLGIGAAVGSPVEIFSVTKGTIQFDQEFRGGSLEDLFSEDYYIHTRSISSLLKYTYTPSETVWEKSYFLAWITN